MGIMYEKTSSCLTNRRLYSWGKYKSSGTNFSLPVKVDQITVFDTIYLTYQDIAVMFSGPFSSLEFYTMMVAKNIWNISL